MTWLKMMLQGGSVNMSSVATKLEACSEEELVAQTRTLGLKEQGALFAAAKGYRSLTLADIVPLGTTPGTQVVHQGKNSLKAFSLFQKRFSMAELGAKELWGFNSHSFSAFTGPGYFTASIRSSELVIDYTRVPPRALPGWPKVVANTGLHGLAYGGLVDTVRGVSSRVSIGAADRRGKSEGFFVLVRLG
jgi:hypothetical protein